MLRSVYNGSADRSHQQPSAGYHPWFSHWIALTQPASKEDHYRALFLPVNAPQNPSLVSSFGRLLPFLPDPIPLPDVLSGLRQNLLAFPQAMLGEVGLDRVCRIPYTPPAPPPYVQYDVRKELSPFTIPLAHQLAVLEAQIDLAVELKRNVSFHSVKSQQATVELLDKLKTRHGDAWYTISVDMHSCGLSAETWKDLEVRIFGIMSIVCLLNTRVEET